MLQYQTPPVAKDWADSRETHMAVAVAIHAIATSKRSPEEIWEAPTSSEWDHVKMAVQNYADNGLYSVEIGETVHWGVESFEVGK